MCGNGLGGGEFMDNPAPGTQRLAGLPPNSKLDPHVFPSLCRTQTGSLIRNKYLQFSAPRIGNRNVVPPSQILLNPICDGGKTRKWEVTLSRKHARTTQRRKRYDPMQNQYFLHRPTHKATLT
eukprot:2241377-Rhodomonas_salina.3